MTEPIASVIIASLMLLGDFSLQYNKEQKALPWALYNPHVEGDAVYLTFASFGDVVTYLVNQK